MSSHEEQTGRRMLAAELNALDLIALALQHLAGEPAGPREIRQAVSAAYPDLDAPEDLLLLIVALAGQSANYLQMCGELVGRDPLTVLDALRSQ